VEIGRNSNAKFLSANIARLSFPLYEALFIVASAETASARKLGEINWRLSMTEENEAQQTGSGMTDAQGKLQSSRTHARQAAEDLKSAAGVIAGEYRVKPSKCGTMPKIAFGRSSKMLTNMCEKIRPRE